MLSPQFSSDGSRIALLSVEEPADNSSGSITRLHVFEGAEGREVFSTTDSNARFLGWSSNSELIMTTPGGRIPAGPLLVDVIAVSTNGSSRRLFSLEQTHFYSLTMAPDRKVLAFVAMNQGRDDIWTVALADGAKPKQITFSGASREFLVNLAFSPDGER